MRKREIVSQLEQAESDIRWLITRVKRLECPHEDVEFKFAYDGYKGIDMFVKVCRDCGKYLEEYSSAEEMFAAKLEYVKERNKKNLDDAKREIAQQE